MARGDNDFSAFVRVLCVKHALIMARISRFKYRFLVTLSCRKCCCESLIALTKSTYDLAFTSLEVINRQHDIGFGITVHGPIEEQSNGQIYENHGISLSQIKLSETK